MKTLYPSYAESLLDSSAPDLTATDIKIAAFTTTDYTYDPAHTHADDLPTAVATTSNLTGKDITGGVLTVDDPSLGSPTSGDTITRLVMYQDSGTPSTSPLLVYMDEDASSAAISVATNGEEITINIGAYLVSLI